MPGALVDCTILIVTYLAARADPGLQSVFIGVLCSMVGARVSLLRRGPSDPGGGSAAVALLVGMGAGAWHLLGRPPIT